LQDHRELKRHSGTPPRTSRRRDAKLTFRGFTAGGSGITSTAAIPINRPRNQIKSAFDFMPVSPRLQRWNDASTEWRHLLLLAVCSCPRRKPLIERAKRWTLRLYLLA
jgi:hypothetical protein